MKYNSFVLILLLPLFFYSCSRVFDQRFEENKDESAFYETESYPSQEYEPSIASGILSKSRMEWDLQEIDNQEVKPIDQAESDQKQKRIYSGEADLLVADLEKAKQEIESHTVDMGGYVESMHSNSIIIRIPAASFNDAFSWILNKGKVRYQSIETADVSEFYNDLFSRLEISIISRDRLYELLSKVTDTTEQVQILKEIGRLTEEIESTKLLLQNLESFISYSRISISLESRLQLDQLSKQEIPFYWIRNLTPLYTYSSGLKAKLSFKPGEDFAVFDKEKIYTADNWDGAKIRISTVENDPVGDGEFWQKALLFHLKDFYKSGEEIVTNFGTSTVSGVLWTSKDINPFQYFTGVFVQGKELHIIEIFSPEVDEDLFIRLFKAMNDGELK
jgi:hypothetical protein